MIGLMTKQLVNDFLPARELQTEGEKALQRGLDSV